jgi:hypothetical protein
MSDQPAQGLYLRYLEGLIRRRQHTDPQIANDDDAERDYWIRRHLADDATRAVQRGER